MIDISVVSGTYSPSTLCRMVVEGFSCGYNGISIGCRIISHTVTFGAFSE